MSSGEVRVPAGLRERQKRARRAALIDAAHDLVERDGLDAVTVEGICAAAGVSARTFFNYFESKDDAVLGMEPLRLDPGVSQTFAAGGPTGELAGDLEVLARSILVAPVMDRRRMAAAADLARREPRLIARHVAWIEQYRAQVEELLRRRLSEDRDETGSGTGGPERSEAFVELAGMTLMVLVRSAMHRWEAAGARGEVADHLGAAKAELRMLLGNP